MDLEIKTAPARFKMADGRSGNGVLEGYASIFGNVDRDNEVVERGAFAKYVSAFKAKGVLAHQHDWKHELGTITDAFEDSIGLKFAAEFYSSDDAQLVRRKLEEKLARGRPQDLSIGFRVHRAEKRKGIRFLTELEPIEVSIVTVASNPAARVTAVKGWPDPHQAKSIGGSPMIDTRDRTVDLMRMKQRAGAQSWAKAITSSTQFKQAKEWSKNVVINVPAPSLKAAGDPVSGFATVAFVPQVVEHAFKPSGLLELLNQRVVDTQSVIVSQSVYPLTNNASFVSEAGLKPEMQPRWSSVTAKLEECAAWCAVSRQAIDDVTGLEMTINTDLQTAIRERVSDRLLNGSGTSPDPLGILNTPGVQVVAFSAGSSIVDSLFKGIDVVQTAGFGQVNGVILNPTDLTSLATSKIPAAGAYVMSPQTLLPTIVSDAHLAQGTALVGDFRYATLLSKGSVRVTMGYVGSDIVNNKMSITAFWRVAIAVTRPQAFAKVALQ